MSKINDASFISFIRTFDVVCLLETFMHVDALPDSLFSNFEKYFSPAIKLSKHGRCSGGIYVFVKSTLSSIQIELSFDIDNVIALELRNLTKKILFISTYIHPQGSSYYNEVQNKNGIHNIEQVIIDLKCKFKTHSFIVCGDFNARTANVQPVLELDTLDAYLENNTPFRDSVSSTYTRKSEDSIINTFGKSFIEMCSSLDLFIVNGMNGGNSQGLFTYVSPHGNSVIDYFLLSDDLLNVITNLKVHVNVESWHMPVSLSLSINNDSVSPAAASKNNKAFSKIIWDVEKSILYKNDFARIFKSQFNYLIDNILLDLDKSVSTFSSLLTNAAESMIKRFTVDSASPPICTWFDTDCQNYKLKVRRSLHAYTNNRTDDNRIHYQQLLRNYSNLKYMKKTNYSEKKTSLLCDSINNSSAFWKEIKNILTPNKTVCSINLHEWYTYFKNIFQVQITKPSICSEPTGILYYDQNMELEMTLNGDFLESEIRNAIQHTQLKKAPGYDCVLNEMLKLNSSDITPFLHVLFQNIFTSGSFPLEWTKSIILPIHKKGSTSLCDNFRPISLTSLISKLYTYILNERLTEFVDAASILPEEQAGFRKGYSTVDHMFTLYAMITKQFSKNRKLYVAFVDFRKCFDLINRDALFTILERNGITGNMLNSIKGMYERVSAAVRCNYELTDFFDCPVGLKQGCLMSPKLFCIFATEISRHLNSHGKHGIQFLPGAAVIHHLLFADDTALISDTITGLQSKLNILYSQCKRLGIEVNLSKTNIVVFRKGGHLSKYEQWQYGENKIEVVNSYKYLGIDFSTRMSFMNSATGLISKAKQSCVQITRALYDIDCCDLGIFTKLFDSKVQPILSYGCELWGLQENINIEQVHTSSLKRFLNVSVHTSNNALYGETSRYPLYITQRVRCVKYWLRLQKMQFNRFPRQAYDMLEKLNDDGVRTWVTEIKELLCTNGFGYVWLFKQVGNLNSFCKVFKDRLQSVFLQNLSSKLELSTHFQCYNSFKSLFHKQTFLSDKSFSRQLRNVLIKFRLGVSQIHCHRYKFSLDVEKRMCPICNVHTEDEFHILFVCQVYEDVRVKYLPNYFIIKRDRAALVELMSNVEHAHQVAIFLFHVFKLRNYILKSADDAL